MPRFLNGRMPGRSWSVAILAAVSFSSAASADSFYASYLSAGVTTPASVTNSYTTFDSITPGSAFSYTTHFNGSSYTGTYSGAGVWYAANEYGGAGGTGTYPELFGGKSYSLTLNKGANYFGLWFSALDAGNLLRFYNGSTLVYSFTPADFITLVGKCPGAAFCGNPNPKFLHEDGGEQFAYLNLYDQNGTFDKIVFSESGGGGFESDNHAVATLNTRPGGTPINTPEPDVLALAGTGLLALLAAARFRFTR